MKIFKYPLALVTHQNIKMPVGAKILLVDVQPLSAVRGQLCLWAEVDPDAPKEDVKIEVHGTGNTISASDTRKHVGSALMDDGRLVWHVYRA